MRSYVDFHGVEYIAYKDSVCENYTVREVTISGGGNNHRIMLYPENGTPLDLEIRANVAAREEAAALPAVDGVAA